MKTNIIIGLLAAGVILLAWPQYQKHQELKRLQAWQAAEKIKDQAKTDEFRQLICPGLKARNDISPTGICKDWK